jgi:hypothetical protein
VSRREAFWINDLEEMPEPTEADGGRQLSLPRKIPVRAGIPEHSSAFIVTRRPPERMSAAAATRRFRFRGCASWRFPMLRETKAPPAGRMPTAEPATARFKSTTSDSLRTQNDSSPARRHAVDAYRRRFSKSGTQGDSKSRRRRGLRVTYTRSRPPSACMQFKTKWGAGNARE